MERNGVPVVSSKNSQRANSAQPGELPGITEGLLKRGYSQYRYSRNSAHENSGHEPGASLQAGLEMTRPGHRLNLH
jgi:hypothetical protein